jgi:RNA polymerase sigma-70 factor (ECF subfamily)
MVTQPPTLDLDVADPAPPDLRSELEQHHADCVGWALACCAWNHAEADDVLQASYLKVLDGRAVFGRQALFRTWLFGVIRRTAREHRRRVALRRLLSIATADAIPAPPVNPVASLERAEDTRALVRALRVLPSRQQQVLHLVFYQGLTIQEAAHVLGVSLGSARTHYERGKARLRQLLRGSGAS